MSGLNVMEGLPRPPWRCARCGLDLIPRETKVAYMDNEFAVELYACPGCGLVFVPEELALGKMLEVEQLLEDK